MNLEVTVKIELLTNEHDPTFKKNEELILKLKSDIDKKTIQSTELLKGMYQSIDFYPIKKVHEY